MHVPHTVDFFLKKMENRVFWQYEPTRVCPVPVLQVELLVLLVVLDVAHLVVDGHQVAQVHLRAHLQAVVVEVGVVPDFFKKNIFKKLKNTLIVAWSSMCST